MVLHFKMGIAVNKEPQTGGSTKNMTYNELQKTAKMLGVKGLTRPAKTLKNAIAYKRRILKMRGGNGDDGDTKTACQGENCGCEDAPQQYEFFTVLGAFEDDDFFLDVLKQLGNSFP